MVFSWWKAPSFKLSSLRNICGSINPYDEHLVLFLFVFLFSSKLFLIRNTSGLFEKYFSALEGHCFFFSNCKYKYPKESYKDAEESRGVTV